MDFERNNRYDLLRSLANDYVSVAIESATREYPHFPYFIATGPESYRLHREFHPAFFGSFDWHSCVEMHLVAVRLLRLFPAETADTPARSVLRELLTGENLAQELAFFQTPANKWLERPYGWGWLMLLALELERWDDPDAAAWAEAVLPLATHLMEALVDWLPRLTYPQRSGIHANTAFSLFNALEYARFHSEHQWESAIQLQGRRLFGNDIDYSFRYEPSGSDFLSPGLCGAVLMQECLDDEEFGQWFGTFLPGQVDTLTSELTPVLVSDPTDGQIAHLHGLNLSRAWALVRLAERYKPESDERRRLIDLASQHAAVSLPVVSGSDYMVEHWLAVYALILLTA